VSSGTDVGHVEKGRKKRETGKALAGGTGRIFSLRRGRAEERRGLSDTRAQRNGIRGFLLFRVRSSTTFAKKRSEDRRMGGNG